MAGWIWKTDQGDFHIQVLGPSRIDLTFQNEVIGSFPTTQEAADNCGQGHHAQISESFDGGSLGVSRTLADWEVLTTAKPEEQ